MEETKMQSLKLSPHPDAQHPHRVLLYAVGALLIIIIALSAGYLLSMNYTQPAQQATLPSITPQPTPITVRIGHETPTQMDTSSWKTYSNTEGHYSFQYPLTYSLHINQAYIGAVAAFQPVSNSIELDSPLQGIPNSSIQIKHELIPSTTTLDDYINKNSLCYQVSSTSGQNLVIDGENAKLYPTTLCGQAGGLGYAYVIHHEYGYQIFFDVQDSDLAVKQLEVSFLSTIHFLK